MSTNIEQPAGHTFSRSIPLTIKVEIHENTHGLLHWTRAQLFGECPSCHSTYNKQIRDWNKIQCENCGSTWNYY